VHITKIAGRYRLTLHTERAGSLGERVLVARSCRDIERDVTLLLALALGEGLAPEPEPEPEVEPPVPTSVEGPPLMAAAPALVEPPPTAAPQAAFRVAVFAGGGAELRMLPRVAGQALVGIELGFPQYWIEPRVSWWPQIEQRLAQGIRADYSGWGGALSACAGWPLAASRVSACLGADVAAVHASSRGASAAGAATAPLYAADAAAAWRWPANASVYLQLELRLRIAFNQARFVIDGLGETHTVPRVLPALAAAIGFSPFR
jgi:hypothetical protein